MKSLLTAALASGSICLTSAAGATAISVTVDGKSYQCSGDTPAQVRVYCNCASDACGGNVQLQLVGINLQTGQTAWTNILHDYSNGFCSETAQLAQCQTDLKATPQCQ